MENLDKHETIHPTPGSTEMSAQKPRIAPGEITKDFVEISGKIIVILTTALYILGFLTVNSYLSKFGYFEQEAVSPRFIISGGLCTIYFLSWYVFSGRAIYNGKTWLSDDINLMISIGAGRNWLHFMMVKSFIKTVFFICMSAASFGFIAFDSPSQMIFLPFMMVAFLISYTIDVTNTDISHPKFSSIAEATIESFAILAFSLSAYIDGKLAALFISFFGMSWYLNMVLDSFERRKSTRDRVIFTSIHSSIFFLTSVTLFGLNFYGDIRTRIGGGQPTPAKIFMSEKITPPGETEETNTLSADIIYRSSSSILVIRKGSPIILQVKGIRMIEIQPIKDTDMIKNLNSIFSKFSLPVPETWKEK